MDLDSLLCFHPKPDFSFISTIPANAIYSSLLSNIKGKKNLQVDPPSSQLIISHTSPGDIPLTTLTATLPNPHGDLMDIMTTSDRELNASEYPVAPTLQLPIDNSDFKMPIVSIQNNACHNELQSFSNDHSIHRTTFSDSQPNIMVRNVSI